ncbi:aspartate carbamoyltransferase catalytic subunit [Yoonia sp. I 8.24]|uniref:aspartate carbamoyltransferase catalytic subunit n=1 Tax=Yoonia sp. I 8.24 TaxID=1537229 RepID=UPI001EDEC899|nr:aspartate carbamoyltransferase catalytic subunit [Yoonia sp. I 8.24]MCG3269358.1 aspartate carbamoyltransferase catalytic subunit [Yoonia sp. I 8.24]
MTKHSSAWDGILDTDEEILWQGRPNPGFAFRPSMIFTTLFGLAFAAFALFWMVMAASAGGYFWMFGLLHFAVGVGIIAGAVFFPSFKRRRTWYTLTNRRAFIATELPMLGKKLKSYPVTPDTPIEFRDDPIPSVMLASETKRGKNSTYTVPIGFELIHDARKVLTLLRSVQKDQK